MIDAELWVPRRERIDHPLAQRLDRHDDWVKLPQLLGSESRSKIVVAGLNQSQSAITQFAGQGAVARTTPLLLHQRSSALRPKLPAQPRHLSNS